MQDDLRELAENLGRAEARLQLGDLELTLRPLTLNEMVASRQDLDALGCTDASPAGLRSQLYYCAKRGGYTGTEADLAEHVTALDVDRVRAALTKLFPTNLQGTWAKAVGLYLEIMADAKLKAVLGPIAEAIEGRVDAVKAAESGAQGEAPDPADGAASAGG